MMYVLYAFVAGAVSAFAFEPVGLWPLLPHRVRACCASSSAGRQVVVARVC